MKVFIIISFFLFSAVNVFSQTLTRETISDSVVRNFVINKNYSLKDFVWAYFDLVDSIDNYFYGEIARKKYGNDLRGKKYLVGDFNNDKKEDIVICGVTRKPEGKYLEYQYRMLVMSNNDSSYTQLDLVPEYLGYFPVLLNSVQIDGKKLIEITRFEPEDFWRGSILIKDTLMYYKGNFVNYNPNPVKRKIKSLTFYTSSNWVTNKPENFVFEDSGKIWYEINNKETLTGSLILSRDKLKEFTELVNYVDPLRLSDEYSKPVFDIDYSHLIIKYKNGTQKKIDDYGSYGTYGLKAIYNTIYGIIYSVKAE